MPCSPPRDLPNPEIKPRSPALHVNSLPLEPPRKPKNTGLGSLFLLQGIFLIQELNLGRLHWECGVLTTGPPGKSQSSLKHEQIQSTYKPWEVSSWPCQSSLTGGSQRRHGVWLAGQGFFNVRGHGPRFSSKPAVGKLAHRPLGC